MAVAERADAREIGFDFSELAFAWKDVMLVERSEGVGRADLEA